MISACTRTHAEKLITHSSVAAEKLPKLRKMCKATCVQTDVTIN